MVVSCASTLRNLHCLWWSLTTACSLKTNPVTACPHLQVVVVPCAPLRNSHCLGWSLVSCSLTAHPLHSPPALTCRWWWCLHPLSNRHWSGLVAHDLFTHIPTAAFTACPHLQVVVVFAPTEKSSLVGLVAHHLFTHIPTAAFSACPHLQVVVVSCASTLRNVHCLCWSLTSCSLKTNPVTACPHLQVVVMFAPLRNLHWLGWLLANCSLESAPALTCRWWWCPVHIP